jgi:hypothetical protein
MQEITWDTSMDAKASKKSPKGHMPCDVVQDQVQVRQCAAMLYWSGGQ